MKKILIFWIISTVFGLYIIWQADVVFLQNWVIETYQLDELQTTKLQTAILSPDNFFLLKVFISVFFCFVPLLFIWQAKQLLQVATVLRSYLQAQFKIFLKPFQNISTSKLIIWGLSLVAINIFALYRLHQKIPHIDEAFSYVHFASKGFWVSALYYPNPNNHILYNLCVAFWDIFLPNKIWAMRLPSFLSFFILQILVFRFFITKFSFAISLLAVMFFALLSPVQAYSTMGRGYLLQMLFLWLFCIFTLKVLNEPSERGHQVLFVLLGWAGFYTLPTFVYYLLAIGLLALFLAFPKPKKIFVLMQSCAALILIVILTYLPIFLLNGKANMFSENWQEFAKQEFVTKKYEYLANFGDFWIGLEDSYAFFWAILGGFALMFLWQKKEKSSLLFVLMPIVVLLIMFAQQNLIPERVWLGFALSWTMLLILASQPLKKQGNVLMILIILGEVFVQFYQIKNQKNEGYANFAEVYPTLPFERGQKIFSNDLIYQNLLAFYNLQDQKGLVIDYSHKAKTYEWLILERNENLQIPENYFLCKETPFVMIFKQN